MNLTIEILMCLCECMAILLCIHSFLGRKFEWDYKTLLLMLILIIVLECIYYLKLSKVWSLLNEAILFGYIWWKFKINWKNNIILIILEILFVGAVQVLAIFPISLLPDNIQNPRIIALLINFITLIFVYVLSRYINVNKVYQRILEYDEIVYGILILCGLAFFYLLIKYKTNDEMILYSYTVSAILVIVVIGTLLKWQKDRYLIQQKTMELKMHELYGKTFEGMIENIRIRQHDFKNQLAAIYGMHLTSDNLEELIKKQQQYCDYLMEEGRFDRILTKCNDRILAGFLYTKFTEVEKNGLEIDFEITLAHEKHKAATYELIQMIGILIDNAMEYELNQGKGNIIVVRMQDDGEHISILCRNQSEYMPMEEVQKIFEKGYSTKGEHRGLGLYNIKKMLENKGEIVVSNQKIRQENWLEFRIKI